MSNPDYPEGVSEKDIDRMEEKFVVPVDMNEGMDIQEKAPRLEENREQMILQGDVLIAEGNKILEKAFNLESEVATLRMQGHNLLSEGHGNHRKAMKMLCQL